VAGFSIPKGIEMDFTAMISLVSDVVMYLIPLALVPVVIKTPWFKGLFGEFLVNSAARLFLKKGRYKLIKDVTLRASDGTTQIDHLILSKFGIFVVETKNMKGWIFGSENQHSWTQKIFKKSIKFQNPLRQNYKHVKALQALTGLKDEHVFSVIVFVGDGTFKTKMPENVTHLKGFISFIKSKKKILISNDQVLFVERKIEEGRLPRSMKTNAEHKKHVKKIIAQKNNQ